MSHAVHLTMSNNEGQNVSTQCPQQTIPSWVSASRGIQIISIRGFPSLCLYWIGVGRERVLGTVCSKPSGLICKFNALMDIPCCDALLDRFHTNWATENFTYSYTPETFRYVPNVWIVSFSSVRSSGNYLYHTIWRVGTATANVYVHCTRKELGAGYTGGNYCYH